MIIDDYSVMGLPAGGVAVASDAPVEIHCSGVHGHMGRHTIRLIVLFPRALN